MSSDFTPDEYEAIRDQVWSEPWHDPGRAWACLTDAFNTLGEVAMKSEDPYAKAAATQSLRRMVRRALYGEFQHEVDTHD